MLFPLVVLLQIFSRVQLQHIAQVLWRVLKQELLKQHLLYQNIQSGRHNLPQDFLPKFKKTPTSSEQDNPINEGCSKSIFYSKNVHDTNQNAATKEPLTSISKQTAQNQKSVTVGSGLNDLKRNKSRKNEPKVYPKRTLKRTDDIPVQDSDIYEVERILDHREIQPRGSRKRFFQYHIRWKGFSSEHDTWENEQHLNAPEVLSVYWRSRGGRS